MVMIREANRNDVEEIINLWEEFTVYLQKMEPDFFQLKPNASEIYRRMLRKMLKFAEYRVFVAEEEENLIGYHVVSIRYPSEVFVQEPYGHISDLYLQAKYRRKDIGSELLKAGITWLKGQGVIRIDVKTYLLNFTGKKFWEKNGFLPFEIAFKNTLGKNQENRQDYISTV